MAGREEPSPVVSRRQGFGCLALALFSLLGAFLFVILGIMCLQSHELFDCIGLITVFPAAFVAIALLSGVVGMQRTMSAGRQITTAARLAGMETGWEPVGLNRPSKESSLGDSHTILRPPGRQEPLSLPESSSRRDDDA